MEDRLRVFGVDPPASARSQELVTSSQPDHDYYAQVKNRHGGKIAAISVARKLTRRCYHILREIDPDQVYVVPD